MCFCFLSINHQRPRGGFLDFLSLFFSVIARILVVFPLEMQTSKTVISRFVFFGNGVINRLLISLLLIVTRPRRFLEISTKKLVTFHATIFLICTSRHKLKFFLASSISFIFFSISLMCELIKFFTYSQFYHWPVKKGWWRHFNKFTFIFLPSYQINQSVTV